MVWHMGKIFAGLKQVLRGPFTADLPPSAPLRFIHGSQLQGTVALVLLRCRSALSWLS